MIRRTVTDYRPLMREDHPAPCPECGAPPGEPCASYCTSHARGGKTATVVAFALFAYVVYLGAGGPAFPH